MQCTVSTLILDERTLRREGLASLLKQTRYDVIAATTSLADLDCGKHAPELVILGFSSGMDQAIGGIERVRRAWPQATLFVVAETADRCDSQELLLAGADGCILNVQSQDVLLKSLELALMHQRVIVMDAGSPSPTAKLSAPIAEGRDPSRDDQARVGKLSIRERQILACLARGDSNKSIARRCCITEATVKVHLKAVVRKLNVNNRTQAAIWALQQGLSMGEAVGWDDLPDLSREEAPRLSAIA